jgi:hypothetical protein
MSSQGFYHEHQQGGLCRMHAVNIALGRRQYDQGSWRYTLTRHDPAWETADIFLEGMLMPMAFMIELAQSDWITWVVPGHLLRNDTLAQAQSRRDLVDPTLRRMIVFSQSHTWCCRGTAEATWYNLDSAGHSLQPTAHSDEQIVSYAANHTGAVFVATKEHVRRVWVPLVCRLASEAHGSDEGAFCMFVDTFIRFQNRLGETPVERSIPEDCLVMRRKDPAMFDQLMEEIEQHLSQHIAEVPQLPPSRLLRAALPTGLYSIAPPSIAPPSIAPPSIAPPSIAHNPTPAPAYRTLEPLKPIRTARPFHYSRMATASQGLSRRFAYRR